jgi:hypothetical protein
MAEYAEPYYRRRPLRRPLVEAALAIIAADPYELRLREHRGHDLPGAWYVYDVNDSISIVFGLLGGSERGHLALGGILDDQDTGDD